MRYYIIAGEASGDLHASKMMQELKLLDINAQFRFWGGDLMEQQGGKPVKHYRDLAFMGFLEVIFHLKTILKNISFCKKDIEEYNPDVLILVDYPGFNLRIAKFAHSIGLKVFYYISPTIWAWHESRVYTIKKYVTRMFVILPFEKDFYKKFDCDVDFVGHPLLDAMDSDLLKTETTTDFLQKNNLESKPIIAILPGSRKQEIAKILPVMLGITKDFPAYQFIIAAVSSIPVEYYTCHFNNEPNVRIITNQTYSILRHSTAAIVKSGTSTLEAALLNIPEVVCYKTSDLTYALGKRFAKVKYISIVNLIMNREVVKELIQDDLNTELLKNELSELLTNTDKRNRILADYKTMIQMLGGSGASKKLASLIYGYLMEGEKN